MFARANMNNPKPQSAAIGRHGDGSFKTSAHKEYPSRFCDALAFSLVKQLQAAVQEGSVRTAQCCPPEVEVWSQQLAQISAFIREGADWLPDFQGWIFLTD